MSKDTFASAKALSAGPAIAELYLLKREGDYKKFIELLEFNERDGEVFHRFENGKEAFFMKNGTTCLIDSDTRNGLIFGTFVQFAAYYLASHW